MTVLVKTQFIYFTSVNTIKCNVSTYLTLNQRDFMSSADCPWNDGGC